MYRHGWYGLETFWSIVENAVVPPVDIKTAAAGKILKLLARASFESQRTVVSRCSCVAVLSLSSIFFFSLLSFMSFMRRFGSTAYAYVCLGVHFSMYRVHYARIPF